MKHKILIYIAILTFSCNTESKSVNESTTISIESSDDQQKDLGHLPPHLLKEDMSMHSFPSECYSSIDKLISFVDEYKKGGFQEKDSEKLMTTTSEYIEKFINDMGDIPEISQSVFQEYSNPIREVFNEIQASSSEKDFQNNLKKATNYLSNFRKIFPE